MRPHKSICIPASPPVDVTELLPIIEHPRFQRLRGRKQLGVNYVVFPGAVHTRFEHALGTLGLTQRLCRVQDIRGAERKALCAYALLHDIGHGPFSHQIEPILGGDHKDRGLEILPDLDDALSAADVDRELLDTYVRGNAPEAAYIDDRNLGTDKLDYLMRDALHIGFTGAPDIERIQFYTCWVDGELAVEEKYLEDIKRIQKFYSYLHQHGYLNKTALTAQRMFQRAVQEQLAAAAVDRETLWDMTDRELAWFLLHGPSPLARGLFQDLESHRLHRTVLAIRPDRYGFVEGGATDRQAVMEWPLRRLRRFSSRLDACDALSAAEDRVAEAVGLGSGDLLFAAMPYFRKLVPRDVRIHSRRETGSFQLFTKDRDHVRSLEGDYKRTFSVRVAVRSSQRRAVLRRADAIADLLSALADE